MHYAADILSRKGRKEVIGRSRDYAKSGQEIEYSFLGRLRFPWQVTLQLSTETFCAVRRSALIPFRCGKQFISFLVVRYHNLSTSRRPALCLYTS